MPSLTRTVVVSAMLALASAQGVITAAKGDKGTSLGLQVDPKNTADANFISQSEITGNVVNGCGRTFALGNIDIGEQTELQLSAGTVTQVSKGGNVDVTISQRDANGTGPFICDMDETSNAGANRPLSVTQDKAATGTGDVTIKVAMPSDLACVGASTGNICTVRCVNAQNFGGCFAVQQSDIKAAVNTPDNIATAQKLDQILEQVNQNKQDLDTAVKAQGSATNTDVQNQQVADAILAADPGIEALPPALTLTNAAAAATSAAANTGRKGNGKGNGAATGNAATGKGNGATTGNAATGKGSGAATGNTATGNTAKGNNNGATAAGNAATGNAATGNAATGNTATGNTAKGNNNGATAAGNTKGSANAAAAAENGKGNNKRDGSSLLRWAKRYVVAGADWAGEDN